MYFDALTMACVADELRAKVLGGRVQAALLAEALAVGLEVYTQHQRHYLLASAHSEWGRVLLSSDKLRRGVENESGLLLLLRKFARGAVVSAIEQPPYERVLRLTLEHPEWGRSELFIEVMGRHSNIILVGQGDQVLDAVKRVGPQLSPSRPVLPGQPYQPPPAQAKLSLPELSEVRLQQILDAGERERLVARALVSGLRGMSPLLAREVAHRALGSARATVDQVERLAPLLEAIHEMLAPRGPGQWYPSAVLENGRPVVYAPYQITHRNGAIPMSSISQAIEQTIAAIASADPYAAAKRPVQEAIAAARDRLEHRREELKRPIEQAVDAELWRRWGEWILAYAHSIVPRQEELVAETGEGEPLRIPLDPDSSPADNAQAYFARYRKVQRATKGGPERLEKVMLALCDLEQLETDLQLASSRPEIDVVRAALVEAGHLRAQSPQVPKILPSRPLSLESPDGFAIWVGRNSRQNDDVTFRRATGEDWWFHARAVPGAHVIVRSGGRSLPFDTVRRAAELAAHFSRLRDEPVVMVDYTQRLHVRRIPHAAPGLVTYSQEQTIRVTPHGP